ncbi:flippase [bacterium]|nr:flippase [bacterium]
MILLSKIAKNTGAVLMGTLVRMGSSFVLILLIARWLGAGGVGEYSIILSLYWIFQKIATMGLEQIIIREVAKAERKAGAYLTAGVIIGIATSVVMSLLMVVFSYLARYNSVIVTSCYIMSGAVLFTTVNLVFQALFIAFEKAELSLYGNVFTGVVRLGLSWAALACGYGIIAIMTVFVLSAFAGMIINMVLTKRCIMTRAVTWEKQVTVWMLKTMPVFAGAQIVNAFSGNITTIIMSLFMSLELVGYYGAAMQLVGAIRMIIQSYKIAIQPVTAKTYVDSLKELRRFCVKSMKYITLFSFPISVGTTLLAQRIISLFYPPEFAISGSLLQVLIWIIPFYGVSMVMTAILIAGEDQKLVFSTLMISLAVRAGLAAALIPLFSYWGAAAAVVASDLVNMLLKAHFIARHYFRISYLHFFWKTAVSAAAMAVILFILKNTVLAVTVSGAVLVYGAALTMLGELPAVRAALKRSGP